MSDGGERFERAVKLLREPVHVDPAIDRRIMAAVQREPAFDRRPRAARRLLGWLVRARPVQVSPLSGLAFAAGIAVIVLVGRGVLAPAGPAAPSPASASASAAANEVQFVVVVPRARTVALVGDFNDWSAGATPMRPASGGSIWSVTIPLTAGRYRYAFLVDGSRWLADPSAPRAVDDDFGPPSSVVTIGGT